MQLLQYTASLPRGSGRWNSCNTLPHCLGAVGSETPAMHCLAAWGQWIVGLLQYTASLPEGTGQWNSCNTLPHCLGALGSGTPAIHCLTAWGQWAVELLQCAASLPGGGGQWNSCNALPHYLGAAGSGTPAIHLLTPVTWHQSKNPQHGSCGTDGPHAVPRSKPVVIRRDCSCVFPSGRAHPARQPSRTPPWARHTVMWGTNAPTWPPATAGRQRSAGSVVGYHRGAAEEMRASP